VGQKRDRDELSQAAGHGVATNGTNGEIPLTKRPKTDDEPASNAASAAASQNGTQDMLHEEEAMRVKNGNQQSAADAKAATEARDDPAEGSEEGEVEE
jgi:hypothetical protein